MKAALKYKARTLAFLMVALFTPMFLSLDFTAWAANSADCERLRRAIADASHSSASAQYQAAADRQRAEIDRTSSYARQIGCDNKKFLFFGSDPPAQCGQIHAQLDRMRANLGDLQSRIGGQGGRTDLIERYNAQCAGQSQPANVIDALFGHPKSGDLQEQPLGPDDKQGDQPPSEPTQMPTGEVRAGAKAVCVRSCDGAFFPLSYSAGSGRLDTLADMCRALCPNAETTLYTYPINGEIEQAVSINGARYMDSPTALRYRHVFDQACSCRRKGQTWAAALAPAENLLGKQDKSDIIVTPEKAQELSLPKADAKAKGAKAAKSGASPRPGPTASPAPLANDGGKTDANGVDTALRDAAAAVSREGSGIADAADNGAKGPLGEERGKTFDETGADGAKRKVRVVGD